MPSRLPPRPNMQGRVVSEMRRRIISRELAPGVSLSETALAESFGVSRTPVREALKQLETEGLVEIQPRVGTFVTTSSRGQLIELFEMKELLEGAAARLLADRGPVPELDRLSDNLIGTRRAADTGDRVEHAELVQQFHDLLIVAAANAKLETHYRMLMNQLGHTRLVTTSPHQWGHLPAVEQDHRRVLDSILGRDGDDAEHRMREHVESGRRALLAGLGASCTGAPPSAR